MAYSVSITYAADGDIRSALDRIAQDSQTRAKEWLESLLARIEELGEMPTRYPLAPEAADLRLDVRQFHHYSHRVVFIVREETVEVFVLRVWHGARNRIEVHHLPPF